MIDDSNHCDMRAGARIANLRHFNSRFTSPSSPKRRNITATKGDEVKTFATARTCSLSMKWNIHSIYHAIAKRRPFKGWELRYE